MNKKNQSFTQLPAYGKLQNHYSRIKNLHMRRLFSVDPQRFEKFSIKHGGLLLDYSKNRITPETISLLCDLAREANLEQWRERMFRGDKINNTENRAVLHTALRSASEEPVYVRNKNVMPEIHGLIDKMSSFAKKIRSGEWKGYTGKPITSIINIGGSNLGPKMVYQALKSYHHESLRVYFVSHLDGGHIDEILEPLNPETTLIIVSSRSFTTQETLLNAQIARDWLLCCIKDERAIAQHFVAVSSNQQLVNNFGISSENRFEFLDWVDSRYSLWSAIGLSIVIVVGADHFKQLLQGANEMDQHFKEAPFEQNMPIIMALLGIWYNNFFKIESHAIFPYDDYLRGLPIYLEQADMESNGKSVDRYGHKVDYPTGPIIWGASGINGQQAFYQSLHQGAKIIPADFIISMKTHSQYQQQHNILFSNALAQTEALMRGRTVNETCTELQTNPDVLGAGEEKLNHQMVFEGNNPTNTLLIEQLSPHTLGSLLALYEHKIFVQGVIWNLNSFEQRGIELGKRLAKQILNEIHQPYLAKSHDASTNALVNYYRETVTDKTMVSMR